MIKILKKWFTLIELLIAITIFFIITFTTYAPYNYYTKKAKLNNATKEISQSLYSARNMAINWLTWLGFNNSVWVYFNNESSVKNKISFFSYPYNLASSLIIPETNLDIKLIKTITLPKWIQFDSINGQDNVLFFFNSISWTGSYYYYYYDPVKNDFSWDEIVVKISYKWSLWASLTKEIIYYTKTNIVDYN